MFAGFGTAEETNARYKYLMAQGNTGLSVAFDLATLMGYDTDAPEAFGEFGKCGVAISSLKDMEILFDGIPLGEVSTSMTINSPAAMLWAFYIAAAEKQGVPMAGLRGTLQNDILKEYQAQKEYIFPPEPSMRLVTDTIEFGSRYLPEWNTISISGYHIREAGATAAQELAFTLGNGLEYVRWALRRGLDIDEFAPRLSFFFNVHNDFFEEIAKLRAARRIWAREMKETFGAKNPRCWLMRFHTQTAGVSLTAQQPEINIVRVAIQALAAVLGGAQSLHTNSMDEALALPSRTRRDDCAAHAADHRARVRRGEHHRSARRQLFCREADQRSRRGSLCLFPPHGGFRRRDPGARSGLFPAGDRGFGLPFPAGSRRRRADDCRRERLPGR